MNFRSAIFLHPDGGVAKVLRVERDVEARVDEVVDTVRHTADLEADVDQRMIACELRDRLAEVEAADPFRRDHAERALGALAETRQRRVLFSDVAEDARGERRVPLARLSQRDAPRGPVDEADADFLLEMRDVPRNEGTGDPQGAGSPVETFDPRHHDERPHDSQPIHLCAQIKVSTAGAASQHQARPRRDAPPRAPQESFRVPARYASRRAPSSAIWLWLNGAAPESNRPSRGLHDRTDFEDPLGHRARPLRW